MTDNEPAGARTPAWPLPDARQLRRALESLGITAYSRTGTRNPLGERGEAAQYAGILHGYLEQIETGLRGGELQTQFQKGWLTGYDRNNAGALGGIAERLDDLSRFAGAGIGQVPLASRQFSTAALALLVAARAFAAAAEIAVENSPDLDTAEKLSEQMMLNAGELHRYVEKLTREFGEVTGEPDVRLDLDE